MHLTKENRYIRRRLRLARKQARQFYYCRKYPINPKKIVFTTIEGTTGFSCNPKYIALELLRRRQDLELVWLVDDMAKEFLLAYARSGTPCRILPTNYRSHLWRQHLQATGIQEEGDR